MVSHPETGSDSPIGSDRDRGRDSTYSIQTISVITKIIYIYKRTTTGVVSIKIYTHIQSPIYLYMYISNTKHMRLRKQRW